MVRYTSHNPGKHLFCKECGNNRNVSATSTYAEDNYTCDQCTKKLIMKNAKLDGRPSLAHK